MQVPNLDLDGNPSLGNQSQITGFLRLHWVDESLILVVPAGRKVLNSYIS